MKGFLQNELELVVRGLPYIIRNRDDPAFEHDPLIGARFVVSNHLPLEVMSCGLHDLGPSRKSEIELTGIERTPTYIIYQMEKR